MLRNNSKQSGESPPLALDVVPLASFLPPPLPFHPVFSPLPSLRKSLNKINLRIYTKY